MENPKANEADLISKPLDEVPKIEPDGDCNARRQDRDTGEFIGYCGNPEGFKTDHPGEGRCKFHGGGSPRGPEHPSFEHGLFSDYLGEEDREAVEALREMDNVEKLQSIVDWRIARLRRALREFFNDDAEEENFWAMFRRVVESTGPVEAAEIQQLAKMLDTGNRAMQSEIDLIRKTIKDIEKIKADRGSSGSFSLEIDPGRGDASGSINVNWEATPEEELEE